ncbi:MAG TPA: universal stress protein [Thermoanaerobaculia bacterium]|nr:universal stress protein [Thermoanaerobaculia bacterium]
MFRKILVPVDFTEKNEAAIQAAQEVLSGHEEAEIYLLHVIEMIEHVEFDEMKDFYHGLEVRAEAKLVRLEERCREAGPACVYHDIQYGKRAEAVVRFAEDHQMDLIILSSHQVDRDHPALGWGTISYRIAIVARCPVLLVK